jgi:glycerol-3-phosphate dehydrogenase (NAD(P)+)
MKVAVLGAGSWGTTVASQVSVNAETVLWARETEVVDAIGATRENSMFLSGFTLPDALHVTNDIEEALDGADVIVVAVPSRFYRSVLELAAPHVSSGVFVVSVTKGIEPTTCLRMTEVIAEVWNHDPATVAVLAGPNLAREVMAGQPSATVIACPAEDNAARLQRLFMTESLRVYTNPDVVGCEIGGAVKNVLAIAAGIADGLGYGWNTKAALITRGLAELARLGVALGGQPLTFLGLAGNGDLMATCSSTQSRNHHVGSELGRGVPLDAILAEMSMVAEGVGTAPAVLELASRYGTDMPIAKTVGAVLNSTIAPAAAVAELMQREPTAELHDLMGSDPA